MVKGEKALLWRDIDFFPEWSLESAPSGMGLSERAIATRSAVRVPGIPHWNSRDTASTRPSLDMPPFTASRLAAGICTASYKTNTGV